VPAGTTLLEAGRRAGLMLAAACGGVGTCGKCRVTVTSGELSAPEEEELRFLGANGSKSGMRLACTARVLSSTVVDVPAEFSGAEQSVHVDASEKLPVVNPLIHTHALHIEMPTMEDAWSDYARITNALTLATGDAMWIMHPAIARQFDELNTPSELLAICRGHEIVGIAEAASRTVGLAVDLGCTKIAAYLMNLETGEQLAAIGVPNPQLPFGEDLISRLVYAANSPARAAELAGRVRESIGALAVELCQSAGVKLSQIADACVVGNTAMMHLLLQLPVTRLLHAPFVAAIDCAQNLLASDLGWSFAPRAMVHILPSIGGFVGADHVAMILAEGIDRTDKVTVGIDIGTNTEIVVRDAARGKFLTTSVPSGPVFEGGHITDGMRAAKGAIDKFFLLDGKLKFHTIGEVPPIGICGSGVLDLLAVLRHTGEIDERGHIVHSGNNGRRELSIRVTCATETGHGREITFTQHDVTQVQLAKAAIYAGISTLLDIAGIPSEKVQEVIVAGQFGLYLHLSSALATGMLPTLPNACYRQVGNAAGRGAKLALLSRSERARARQIAKSAQRIELKQHSMFDREMARGTRFPPSKNGDTSDQSSASCNTATANWDRRFGTK